MLFCVLFWGSICLSVSAEKVSVTEVTRPRAANGLDYMPLVYDRQPGIYFKSFTLTMKGTLRHRDFSVTGGGNFGIWKIPYNEVPGQPGTGQSSVPIGSSANSTKLTDFRKQAEGTTLTVTQSITGCNCFTGCAGAIDGDATLDANYKYWYRVYPYDGSVTPSNTSGSALGGAKTVTFSTPKCTWPTYYNGTNSWNTMKTGSLWPDVLVSYSTTGTPGDPEYGNWKNDGIFTYSATGAANDNKTTASLNLAANQTYHIKVRLGVNNGGDYKDVEYSKVNSFTYYTYTAPTASPAAGTYAAPQKVTLSGAAGTTIRYTTNGANPTASSTVYSAPIPVKGAVVIKAQLYVGNTAVGPVGTYNYSINPSAVIASPNAGACWNTQEVSLSCNGGYELYYTTDGTVPTKETGVKYAALIQLTDNTKLRVQRYFDGEPIGSVVDFNYTINIPGVKADPAAGAVGQGTKVAFSLTSGDAAKNALYYTENDALPYDRWIPYTLPIEITKDTTLYAVVRDKISGRYGEKAAFAYQYSELGYILNDLSFWEGGTKVTSTDLSALAGKTLTAKANITKIIPSIQGWLVTALYDPSGRAVQIKLDKLDQLSGIATGDVSGKPIALPENATNYVLKTFIVHDFTNLRPIGAVVQIGEKAE